MNVIGVERGWLFHWPASQAETRCHVAPAFLKALGLQEVATLLEAEDNIRSVWDDLLLNPVQPLHCLNSLASTEGKFDYVLTRCTEDLLCLRVRSWCENHTKGWQALYHKLEAARAAARAVLVIEGQKHPMLHGSFVDVIWELPPQPIQDPTLLLRPLVGEVEHAVNCSGRPPLPRQDAHLKPCLEEQNCIVLDESSSPLALLFLSFDQIRSEPWPECWTFWHGPWAPARYFRPWVESRQLEWLAAVFKAHAIGQQRLGAERRKLHSLIGRLRGSAQDVASRGRWEPSDVQGILTELWAHCVLLESDAHVLDLQSRRLTHALLLLAQHLWVGPNGTMNQTAALRYRVDEVAAQIIADRDLIRSLGEHANARADLYIAEASRKITQVSTWIAIGALFAACAGLTIAYMDMEYGRKSYELQLQDVASRPAITDNSWRPPDEKVPHTARPLARTAWEPP